MSGFKLLGPDLSETPEAQQAKSTQTVELKVATLEPPPSDTPLSESQKQGLTFKSFEQFMAEQNRSSFGQLVAKHQQSWCLLAWFEAYADVICNWLYLLHQDQHLEEGSPIYLLEAEAGTGQFGLSLMQMVQQKLSEMSLPTLPICYVFAFSDVSNKRTLSQHPLWQIYAKKNKTRLIEWDVLNADPLPECDCDGNHLNFAANPVVFIANGVLSHLPQQLLYVHYSDLYAGTVASITHRNSEGQSDEKLHNLTPLNLITNQQTTDKNNLSPEEAGNNTGSKHTLGYQWRATTPEEFSRTQDMPLRLQSFIQQYLEQELSDCHCGPLYLPTVALRLIHGLQQVCERGIICLQSDDGDSGIFPVPQRFFLKKSIKVNSVSCPVNFSCLNRYPGFWGELWQDCAHGKVISCSGFITDIDAAKQQSTSDSENDLNEETSEFISIAELLKTLAEITFQPVTPQYVEQTLSSLTLTTNALATGQQSGTLIFSENQMLALLAQYHYEPQLMAFFIPTLLKEGVAISQRTKWCQILSKVWEQYTTVRSRLQLTFKLGLLAVEISHWSLAKQCFITILQLDGPNLACLHNLAVIAMATHQMATAHRYIAAALEIAPEDELALTLHEELKHYHQYCKSVHWYQMEEPDVPNTTPDEERQVNEAKRQNNANIQVVPLGQHHLGEFFNQYRQPNIAQRLRGLVIEEFHYLDQLLEKWQQQGLNGTNAQYAIIHKRLGLVGGITVDFTDYDSESESMENIEPPQKAGSETPHSKIPSADLPVISFWVGQDYQRMGFATSAVAHVMAYMKQMEGTDGSEASKVTGLKTSVLIHNKASQKVLEKNGFLRVGEDQARGELQYEI